MIELLVDALLGQRLLNIWIELGAFSYQPRSIEPRKLVFKRLLNGLASIRKDSLRDKPV